MNQFGEIGLLGKVFLRLFSALSRLYPARYRFEFKDELTSIYQMELATASRKGLSALFICGLRELRDMPAAILQQHLRERRYQTMQLPGENHVDFPGNSTERKYPIPTRLEMLLAFLPHLLFLLPSAISQFIIAFNPALAENDAGKIAQRVMLVVIGGFVVAVVWLIAWRRKWPLWSASWYGYWAWLVLVIVSLLNQRFQLFISWKFNNVLILGVIGLLALGYLWQVRKDALRGLLSVLFLMPVITLSFMEFIPPFWEGLIYLGTAMVVSLTVIGILTLRDTQSSTLLVLGANLVVGSGITFISVYFPEYPSGVPYIPSLVDFIGQIVFYSILVVVLILGPLAFWAVWDLVRRKLA